MTSISYPFRGRTVMMPNRSPGPITVKSALEFELESLLPRLRRAIMDRDRAVLLGFLLCLVPFLPVTIVGFVVTILNAALVVAGKLPRREIPLLVAGVVVSLLYLVAWGIAFHLLWRVGLPGAVFGQVHSWFSMIEGLFRAHLHTGPSAFTI